jgi:hypothetical protein
VGFSLPRGCTGLFFWGWVGGVSRGAMRGAHLFLLQFHAGSFVASQGRNGANVFSTASHREAFHRLRVQDDAKFDFD